MLLHLPSSTLCTNTYFSQDYLQNRKQKIVPKNILYMKILYHSTTLPSLEGQKFVSNFSTVYHIYGKSISSIVRISDSSIVHVLIRVESAFQIRWWENIWFEKRQVDRPLFYSCPPYLDIYERPREYSSTYHSLFCCLVVCLSVSEP